jgi:glycosyltransferase involved in cell wall biosynthesis
MNKQGQNFQLNKIVECELPLVSVIIPAYNCEKFINQAIECIINQTYKNLEILLCDDTSKDKTRKIIDSYTDPRIKCFYNEKNLGYLETWNKLMKEAVGEFITFQDADDLCALNRIELLLNELNNNLNLAVVGSNFKRINTADDIVDTSNFHLDHEEVFHAMPKEFHFIGSALMIRKSVYETVGGYHTFFNRMGAEDHYWVYLIMEKFKFKNIAEPLYFYRFNEASVTGNISNNPSKLNVPLLLDHLINQRKETGTDDLQKGKIDELTEKLNKLNKPFNDDKSFYFYYVAKRRFYEGRKQLALQNLRQAIKMSPFNLRYYKDYFYFLRN